jgi:hypothetical protein
MSQNDRERDLLYSYGKKEKARQEQACPHFRDPGPHRLSVGRALPADRG